jgi:hypothetical protein
VVLFIAFVFAGQVAEGTNIIFALLTAAFNVIWATAFNVAGGLEYPSGAFVFAYGLFSVVIGFSAKVVLFEPGERNLRSPFETMLCYTVSMAMILLVCFLVKALRPQRPLISPPASLLQMKYASIACIGVVILQTFASGTSLNASGSLASAVRQISGFGDMAIFLATTYEIQRTNGRRSVNWVTVVMIAFGIFYGLVYFGKTSLLEGFLAWALAASIQGYNFKKHTLVGLSLAGFFMVYYMVPYSQYVRTKGSETGSLRENIPVAIEYLSDLNHTRSLYLEVVNNSDINQGVHLYDKDEGFLDRLIIVAIDDALIHYTDEGNVFGLTPTWTEIASLVPHFIWKDKPLVNTGNSYAHELNLLSEDDPTTGVAFSITSDAYHQATWLGILLVLPASLFFCFIISDSITGSAKYSPFALLPVINLFNGAATGGVGLPIRQGIYGTISLLLIVWVCKVVTPFVMKTIGRDSPAPSSLMPIGRAATVPQVTVSNLRRPV